MTTGENLHVADLDVPRGDRPVLRGVTLDIPAGEITTLLGPNGAGKSTLVLTIGGMLRPTGGSITIDDTDLTEAKPEHVRAAGVAVVPRGAACSRASPVEDNLKVATYSLPPAEAAAGIAYALELFPEIERRFKTTARSLSGGEQQMLVLAQALASKPKVIVVDELSLGLAPVIVKRLMPVLERVVEHGVGSAAHRTVRSRRTGVGDQGIRDRGRRDQVLGHRRRTARQPRRPPLGLHARLDRGELSRLSRRLRPSR